MLFRSGEEGLVVRMRVDEDQSARHGGIVSYGRVVRIMHVSDCYAPRTGGIETQVQALAARQAAAGDEVRVVTATPGHGLVWSGEDRVDGIPVHRVVARMPFELPVHPRTAREVGILLDGHQVDIVHVHAGVVSPFAWGAVRAAARRRLPVLVTVHSVWGPLAGPGFTLSDAVGKWTGWGVTLSAVSSLAASRIRDAVPKAGEVLVVPNGIDPGQWRVTHQPGAAEELRIASVMRMAPRKRDHVLGVWGIIDLLSILPTYIFYATHALHVVGLPISLSGGLMLKALRTMRVLRVLRTLKLSKDADARLKATLESPASPFWMDFQIYLIALFIALLTSATLIWNVEFDPDIENSGTPFTNIAISMWWAIVTLCNVGYGDMIPATMLGRIIGGVTSLVGLLLFGVLTSVITKALMGPVFGTETEKPVVEPDVFYFNPSNGTVGSSDTMATSNVDNLLSLGVIDAAEASALRDRLIGAQPEPADAGTAHRTH